MLKGDRTTGLLGSDFTKIAKVWPYVWRLYDNALQKHLNNPEISVTKYSLKMCVTCLKSYNIEVPAKIGEKQKAVAKHQQSMKCKSNKIKEIKIHPIIITSYKLAAQLMAPKEKNIEDVKIHCKQYLNELHEIDKLSKLLSNKTKKNPMWLS